MTDLPDPDSPITHRTLPRSRLNESPLTASTVASRLTKRTRRSRTSMNGGSATCWDAAAEFLSLTSAAALNGSVIRRGARLWPDPG